MSLRICKVVILCSFSLLAFTACDSSDINDSSDDDGDNTVVTGKFSVVFSLEDYLNNRAAWERNGINTYSFDLTYHKIDGFEENNTRTVVGVEYGSFYGMLIKEGKPEVNGEKLFFKSVDEIYDFILKEYLYWFTAPRPEGVDEKLFIEVNYDTEYNFPWSVDICVYYGDEKGLLSRSVGIASFDPFGLHLLDE